MLLKALNTQSIQPKRMYSMSLKTLDDSAPLSINVEFPNAFTVESAVRYSLNILNE